MKRFKQKSTYVSLAVSAFLAAGSAIAEIEEITVTANKREQSLQDVPMTVSVTSAETIEQSSIVDLIDLQTAVHTRNSLNAVWSASSTQVFHPSCINGSYSHFDLVYVVPPSGWVYTGTQPITVPNPATALVSNC